MHTRPPASDRKRAKRERRRLAQREYRRRLDEGKLLVEFEIDADVIDMLVSNNWLDGKCEDRKKIGKALSAMVAEAAKR
jgi:hypothetical protein